MRGSSSTTRQRLLWTLPAFCASAAAPLAVRGALVLQAGGPVGRADLLGLFSDLALALLFATPLALLARRSAGAALLASSLWGLLHYADYEHVRELGAGLNFHFAHYLVDPTFFRGSALAVSNPALLAAAVAVPMAFTWLAARSDDRSGAWLPTLAIGAALVATVSALPTDDAILAWHQRHFLHETLESALRSHSPGDDSEAAAPPRELAADLGGTPWIPLPGLGKNVLLLILEGIPASALAPLAEADGDLRFVMPQLSALAERNASLSNFVLHQRQTNRGVYSLLCGDYPKLDDSLAKMTAYANGSDRPCLPSVLAEAAYQTAYLQAAPLAFMYKDAFARRAGFQRILGNKDFAHPLLRSYWGVDDRSLLRRAALLVRELDAGEAPWFLTILSVGTHHPTVVPRAFEKRVDRRGFEAAVQYLDRALATFVSELASDGILDDTVVLITSDESRGNGSSSGLHSALSRNWGPLVMLLPERSQRVITEPFGQSDVAISLLDYLGIPPKGSGFIGRSLFRSYAEARRVYFANVFLRKTGGVDGSGFAFQCDAEAQSCTRYAARTANLFLPETRGEALDSPAQEALRAAIRHSRHVGSAERSEFGFDLVGDPMVPIVGHTSQLLMGGQNFEIPAGSRIEVLIRLRVDGTGGTVGLRHWLSERIYGDHVEELIGDLGPGDSAEIRYALVTPREMKNVALKLDARVDAAEDLSVRFETARMQVRPLLGEVEEVGVVDAPSISVTRATGRP